MKPFESPDDALPAPLPEGSYVDGSASCLPKSGNQEKLDEEAEKVALHERLSDALDEQA
jgi:hypothetical protein